MGMVQAIRHRYEPRFVLIGLGIMIVGFGSSAFHGTLLFEYQMADELPMIWSIMVSARTCLSDQRLEREGLKREGLERERLERAHPPANSFFCARSLAGLELRHVPVRVHQDDGEAHRDGHDLRHVRHRAFTQILNSNRASPSTNRRRTQVYSVMHVYFAFTTTFQLNFAPMTLISGYILHRQCCEHTGASFIPFVRVRKRLPSEHFNTKEIQNLYESASARAKRASGSGQ